MEVRETRIEDNGLIKAKGQDNVFLENCPGWELFVLIHFHSCHQWSALYRSAILFL